MRQIIPFSKEIVFKTNIATITSISLEHEEKVFDGEISGDFIILGDYKIHNDTTEKEIFKYRLPFTALIPDTISKESVVVDVIDFTYEQIENDVLKVDIQFSVDGEEKEEEQKEEQVILMNEKDVSLPTEETKEEKTEEMKEEPTREEKETVLPVSCEEASSEENRKYEEELDQFLEQLEPNEKESFPEEVIIAEEKKIEPITPTVLEKEENVSYETEPEREQQVEEMVSNIEKVETKEEEEYVTYHIHIVKAEESLESIVRNYGVSLEFIQEYNDIKNIQIGDKIIIPDVVDE